jgi:phage-related protein
LRLIWLLVVGPRRPRHPSKIAAAAQNGPLRSRFAMWSVPLLCLCRQIREPPSEICNCRLLTKLLLYGMWTVYYDPRLEDWLEAIPADIKARILRIVDMLLEYGPANVREPYVSHLQGHGRLYEIRAKGKDGIARVFYFAWHGKKIVLLHGFTKKSVKTPRREIEVAVKRMKEVILWLS